MDDSLAEIALNSFEASENADNEQDENNAQGSESEQEAPKEPDDTNTANKAENEPEDESDGNNNDSDDGKGADEEDESEKEDSEDDSSSEEDEKESEETDKEETDSKDDKKQEISDEEFEKLAKERGYAKKAEQDTQRQQERQDRSALANATKRPKEVDKETWDNMPAINKVIYNQLPYITAVGKDGNTIRVKTPQQLPDDFEFASKKAELQFQSDIQEQTTRAEHANAEIQQRIENMKAEQARTANARAIVSEVEALQKSGDLPTPKAKPGTKEFDSDEAVVLTNKVLSYYNQRRANGDRMSIKDALILYKSMNPDEFKSKKEAKGDSERKEIAKKISGVNKSADTSTTKSNKTKYFKPGMDIQDIVDRAFEDME